MGGRVRSANPALTCWRRHLKGRSNGAGPIARGTQVAKAKRAALATAERALVAARHGRDEATKAVRDADGKTAERKAAERKAAADATDAFRAATAARDRAKADLDHAESAAAAADPARARRRPCSI